MNYFKKDNLSTIYVYNCHYGVKKMKKLNICLKKFGWNRI